MKNGCFGFALGMRMQDIYKHQAENVSHAFHCKEVENSEVALNNPENAFCTSINIPLPVQRVFSVANRSDCKKRGIGGGGIETERRMSELMVGKVDELRTSDVLFGKLLLTSFLIESLLVPTWMTFDVAFFFLQIITCRIISNI